MVDPGEEYVLRVDREYQREEVDDAVKTEADLTHLCDVTNDCSNGDSHSIARYQFLWNALEETEYRALAVDHAETLYDHREAQYCHTYWRSLQNPSSEEGDVTQYKQLARDINSLSVFEVQHVLCVYYCGQCDYSKNHDSKHGEGLNLEVFPVYVAREWKHNIEMHMVHYSNEEHTKAVRELMFIIVSN